MPFLETFGSCRVWCELTKFSFWGRNNSQTDTAYKTKYFKASKKAFVAFNIQQQLGGTGKKRSYSRNPKVEMLSVDFIFISVPRWITLSSNFIDLCRRARDLS